MVNNDSSRLGTILLIFGMLIIAMLLIFGIINTIMNNTVEVILGFLLLVSSGVLYSEAIQK